MSNIMTSSMAFFIHFINEKYMQTAVKQMQKNPLNNIQKLFVSLTKVLQFM